MTVLVKLGDAILGRAIRNLAVLRYIQEAIPVTNHWYPVFERYIDQVAGQVKGLGVDPGSIKPSPDDPGIPGRRHGKGDRECFAGKIKEVKFDCFGEFEGFVVENCDECRHFDCREPGIGRIAWLACRQRLWVEVCPACGREGKIGGISILSDAPKGIC